MDLERFIKAQENSYSVALAEIRSGKKLTHWMWYIFPQLRGLGRSYTSQYYGIQGRAEAEAYLGHPTLSSRLVEISESLLQLNCDDASEIFGYIDDLKLQSSMTLFFIVGGNPVFKGVLEKFFKGELDEKTVELLQKE